MSIVITTIALSTAHSLEAVLSLTPVLSIPPRQQQLHVLTQAHIDCQSPPTHYKHLLPLQPLFHLLSGTARVLLGCRYDHIRTSQRGPRLNGLLY